jgi:nucleotide-binding universal stress UspA family protein
MNPIVCAIDGSAASARVIDEATALAAELRAPPLLADAEPAQDLLALTRERRAAIVVAAGALGLPAARGRMRALLRGLDCPLVAVPPRAGSAGGAEGATIVCGVDGSGLAPAAVTAGLAARLRARPIALHAADTNHDLQPDEMAAAARALSAGADRIGTDAEARFVNGPAAQMLEAVAAREQSRLIVVGSCARGPLHSAFRGSVSRWLAGHASRPVVIVPPGLRAHVAPVVKWGFSCIDAPSEPRHHWDSLPKGIAMGLFSRKPKEDLPENRCPQCGEALAKENPVECLMCGADLRPLNPRVEHETQSALR